MNDMKKRSEEYWKEKLTPEQYKVMREKGTESPFSGKYTNNAESGVYRCAACGAMLFTSEAQHESTTPGLAGWPSFSEIAESGSVELVEDNSLGMQRIEAICANCGGHLGHVFDGVKDTPTGKHYCINSCALDFKPKK